jgi:hypothetical protein
MPDRERPDTSRPYPIFLWNLYGTGKRPYRKFMPWGRTMPPMKRSSSMHPPMPKATRGFALIALALAFLLSVFQLTHLPVVSANHDVINLWRGLAVGTLFLFFCFPTARQPPSGH